MGVAAANRNRLRWQSRRGWLELDLLLQNFWRQHGDALSEGEAQTLAGWLAQSDEALWRALQKPPASGRALAQKIVGGADAAKN